MLVIHVISMTLMTLEAGVDTIYIMQLNDC